MKARSYFILIGFFLISGNTLTLFSQSCIDELKTKLPKADQYKLLKAEKFLAKGQAILSVIQDPPDTTEVGSANSSLVEKELENYYVDRIKASYCIRNANGLLFGVVDNHIKAFWANFKEDKRPFEPVIHIENTAYDSLVLADSLRAEAENALYMEDKIPLVSRAEQIENIALLKLEKILYTYLNLPLNPNLPWLVNKDINLPGSESATGLVLSVSDTTKGTIRIKANNIYALLHISEEQMDSFNEFLKKKYSKTGQTDVIDFQKLYDTVIDSLHQEWHRYATFKNIVSDTVKASPFVKQKNQGLPFLIERNSHPADPAQEKFSFRIQIAACRVRMTETELKGIYSGKEKIEESVEDNWFKYSIGHFKSYAEATDFMNHINIKEAFVPKSQN